ncbi:MAG: hypothetical protein GAK45_01732 [Pseudomonas citronellolis]|nr:MAG: hypothetical protein GAK45_01732 [Pseudomonas citronellolis]
MPHYIATVTVSTELRGGEAEAIDNAKVSVELSGPEDGVIEVRFAGQLDAPQDPTHVCVTLPNGLSFYGAILGGEANSQGGWLRFEGQWFDLDGL